jgi:anti-sigma regulatory factor (Ser/Thr protein kinase)
MLVDRLTDRGALGPGMPGRPDQSLELELAALPPSVAEARRAARAACQAWDVAHAAEDAALAVSELVTNAVVHAGTPLLLAMELDDRNLTVAVSDGSQGMPWQAPPSRTREGGRGVAIVSGLGATWGVVRTVLGKTVWMNLTV